MSSTPIPEKVIIIGAGCAGLSAAIYCARAELSPLLFAGDFEDKGGLLVKTSIVENYPGFPDGILGYDLVNQMEEQATKQGTRIINRPIVKVDLSSRPFTVVDSSGQVYSSLTLIIATGSQPNKLGLPREAELWSHGISSCAVCDGALFKNKKIVVVGGGDSALEEALFLTKFSQVTLIHRRDTFRASKIMQKRVLEHPKIQILYNTIITELHGENHLDAVSLKNVDTGEVSKLAVDGLFYGLGLTPNTQLFAGQVDRDSDGYIRHASSEYETMTSVPGVFVAGDAHDKIYRQAIVAAGDGCRASLDVNTYLNSSH
jgi:thioredoxin reductase (NADPH)